MKKGFLALFLVAFAAVTCWGQSTFKPKFERQPWDTYVGVKGGAIYSNLTALHGEAKITGTGEYIPNLSLPSRSPSKPS